MIKHFLSFFITKYPNLNSVVMNHNWLICRQQWFSMTYLNKATEIFPIEWVRSRVFPNTSMAKSFQKYY